MIEDSGSGFQFTVLTGLFLQIYVDITVVVAMLLIVDGRIGHTELFADAGDQVGGLVDTLVDECTVQIGQRTEVIAHSMIARG